MEAKTAAVERSEAAAHEMLAGDPAAELVIALGRAYHQAGVPSDQLESIMHEVAVALRLELQVTALPTSITAAIGAAQRQNVVLLRLDPGTIDLRRLALLNALYEEILHDRTDARGALARVSAIDSLAHARNAPTTISAYTALSLGVGIILGGGRDEIFAAGAVGFATGTLAVLARYFPTISRLFEVLAAFVATAIVTLYARAVHPLGAYVPLVAGVVQLLPGFQLTAALHELAYRNMVAGTARLGSVLMTILSLGSGFAIGIAVVGTSALHMMPRIAMTPLSWYAIALAVAGVSTGIAILENARPVDYPLVVGSCAVAEISYRAFLALPVHQVATLGSAFAVGILSAIGARYARVPQAVLLFPGLLVLVPGALSYESILFILQSDAADAANIAASSAIGAVEIVMGVLLAQLFFSPTRREHAHASELT